MAGGDDLNLCADTEIVLVNNFSAPVVTAGYGINKCPQTGIVLLAFAE